MRSRTRLRSRYWRILRFALHYIASEWWFGSVLPHLGLGARARRSRDARFLGIARAFRALAADLGGLMIKVGQFMSTRMDVLPTEITDELAALQDEVSPVEFPAIERLIEVELGAPLLQCYAEFDPAPLASASLGQAHRARLLPQDAAQAGFTDAVVKVQRPGIEDVIEVDLAALRRVAGWLHRIPAIRRRTDLPGLVEEFARSSEQEIDYLHEADNAVRFAGNFSGPGDGDVRVPLVDRARTTRRVLTLSDVTGIKISEVGALTAAGIDPSAVADRLAMAMFDQFFMDGFFHADPHPGNLFVAPETPEEPWRLTFVDFGMMGQVDESVRDGVKSLALAVITRDGTAMVQAMLGLGALLPSADTAGLERALTELFDRFGGMDPSELQNLDPAEFSDFAEDFGETMRSMPFQLPENFLLIFRAVGLLSGVCTALNPDFNIWRSVQPYIEGMVQPAADGSVKEIADRAAQTLRTTIALPGRADRVLTRMERGELEVNTPKIDRLLRRIERLLRMLVATGVFVAFFLGGILLLGHSAFWGGAALIGSIVPFLMIFSAGRPRPRPHR